MAYGCFTRSWRGSGGIDGSREHEVIRALHSCFFEEDCVVPLNAVGTLVGAAGVPGVPGVPVAAAPPPEFSA